MSGLIYVSLKDLVGEALVLMFRLFYCCGQLEKREQKLKLLIDINNL